MTRLDSDKLTCHSWTQHAKRQLTTFPESHDMKMPLLYILLTICQVIPILSAPVQDLRPLPFTPAVYDGPQGEAIRRRHINESLSTSNPYDAGYAPVGTRTLTLLPTPIITQSIPTPSVGQPQPGALSSLITTLQSLQSSGHSVTKTTIVRPPQTGTPASSYREGYSPVAVITVTHSSGVDQVLPPSTGPLPNTSGTCVSSLETEGRPTCQPFNTEPIPEPVTTEPVAAPATICSCNTVPASTFTTTTRSSSTSTKPATSTKTSTMAQPTATPRNIFAAPIATNAPSNMFPVRNDHPVPRKGVKKSSPVGTNKFYGNLFLGNQNSQVYVHPYSVAWAKGQGATSSWGMCVSHIEANQRVFGERKAETGAARYFLNPVGIQSLCLSAVELGSAATLTTDNLKSQSANVNLHAYPNAQPMITFPLVQGMAYVTAVYHSGTPVISTGILFKTVTRSNKSPKPGVTKYTMYLENGKVWHVYAYAQSGNPLDLRVINNGLARSATPFTGFIQIAKDPGGAETILDAACAAYPVGVTLSGTANGKRGTYTFTFEKAGDQNTKLLMYALPHHLASFSKATAGAVQDKIRLQTTTKGIAKAVLADSWIMVEPNMPVSMDFAPWDPSSGPKRVLSNAAIEIIRPVALKEISQDMNAQTNQDSMYFAGKALAKFASICYTVNDLLKDPATAKAGLASLKAAFNRFATNKQIFPLYYENAWGGIVSSATYTTGNNGADFGNTFYNDHHFHYGYFVLTAAIIGYLDPSWMTKTNIDFVNTLVRDISNPSTADKYFPVSRNFDWYHGHSWAHGLYETADGNDQESSSEDTMHAYAIKMWGKTVKDTSMEARGNLMLAIQSRSLNHYYLYTADNNVQPPEFIGNKVAGILFENKIDHTTYFGMNLEYIQGIHMLPLLPSTKYTRPSQFVNEEWSALFNQGRADRIEGGWRGILYGNLATIDANTAWQFFTRRDFNPSWLDGGASLTWYQAYTAAFMA
ncbi:endo-1,3(4)-beta-glucanase [Microdochium nivale]|nr:endo-1,3(4)-beta-glucanase [Microdochium nivale]